MMQEDGDLFIATCDDGFSSMSSDCVEILPKSSLSTTESMLSRRHFVIFKRVYIIAAALFTAYIVQFFLLSWLLGKNRKVRKCGSLS
ncbi:hypothetical protein J4732_01520 [Serratia marcescens]|uniref:Uncharacterized protein n=1 Tax=Serratia marcescens TaxID=615 RepID=A0A939NLG8_SERMA|nr:hypothetical protein [Serratia marcescens]